MRLFPIIPIAVMSVICIGLIGWIVFWGRKDWKGIWRKNWIHFALIVLIFVINLRPMMPIGNATIMTNNLDVLFVIDSTISMVAEDYNGNNTRLSGVKKDCQHIVEELSGARFALITFNNSAKVVAPYTFDQDMILDAVDVVRPVDYYSATGSSFDKPIEEMKKTLEASKKKGDRVRIVFFMSDGEITNKKELPSYGGLKSYIEKGAVMGYGTANGGRMKETNFGNERAGIEDEFYIMKLRSDEDGYSGGDAISKIDENNLQKIAGDMGVKYVHMNNQKDIDGVLSEVKGLINSEFEPTNQENFEDIYFVLMVPVILLLLLEFNKYRWSKI